MENLEVVESDQDSEGRLLLPSFFPVNFHEFFKIIFIILKQILFCFIASLSMSNFNGF